MTGYHASERERWVSVAGVAIVHAALAAALLSGLAPRLTAVRDVALATFDVIPPAPPPPVVAPAPVTAKTPEPEGEAAPPALRAVPKPVAAPKPIVPPPRPLPAPPKAAEGTAISAGAAPTPGPGTGAGGVGDGLGSGANGTGTGGGGGTSATLIRGAIVNRDYPGEARRAKLGGTVTVAFTVQPNGRATGCSVARSSGVASLDATTCRLVEKRFRYTPARDAAGNAVAEKRGWRQRWWLEGEGNPPLAD
jgi:periplasmic protein TonB